MTDESEDPWKTYLRDVKALSFPAKVEKKLKKVHLRGRNPLKAFLDKVPFENVSRETFLENNKIQGISRKKTRNAKLEKTLDLHGLTLKEAYLELSSFLWKASHQGLRTVLIITGKGRGSRSLGEDDKPRLNLKDAVPSWLQESPLNSLVGSWSKAAHEHGGDGALYVFLRTIPLK